MIIAILLFEWIRLQLKSNQLLSVITFETIHRIPVYKNIIGNQIFVIGFFNVTCETGLALIKQCKLMELGKKCNVCCINLYFVDREREVC